MGKENAIILEPKPSQEIWERFDISGWVPRSWLKTEWGKVDYRIFVDFLNIKGKEWTSGPIIDIKPGLFSRFKRKFKFKFGIDCRNVGEDYSIKNSHGRINIKLSWPNKEKSAIFIPIILKYAEPKEGVNPDFVDKHVKIGEMVERYEKNLKDYYRELDEIRRSRKLKEKISEDEKLNKFSYSNNWEVVGSLLNLLNEGEDVSATNPYTEEDRREKELEDKFKNVLEWRGPLFGGMVGRMNGYEFRLYSNDHDKHFHVIHRDKGINARFSFPNIELLNYKSNPNSISSKDIKRIQDFFHVPANLQKLEAEFTKRV
jgi:hypothetical protein